jgi:hypothetical protein
MAQDYLRELIRCEKCGNSYTNNYTTCPYCQAEERAYEISRKKNKRSTSPLAVLMALVLLAGAAGLGYQSLGTGSVAFGREYEVVKEEELVQPISSSVTQQRTRIAETSEETDSPEETDAPDETDSPEETDTPNEDE